jgi:DNA-binding beta-propeller fold protein YncE
LPENWLLGQVPGISVDSEDNVWLIHRPGSLTNHEGGDFWETRKLPFTPAPPVIQFDPEGNVIRAWGGPGEGYDWQGGEHGIYIDPEDNVWLAASGQAFKFTKDGEMLLKIGRFRESGGSNDLELLGSPTEFWVDADENEVYIADGYRNKRVIVFDATTGDYKRHWGAYGNTPDDAEQNPFDPNGEPPQQFGDVVHAVKISHDGLVYVCDRSNNRIQVFNKDGKFIFERFIAKNTAPLGSTWDFDFSRDPKQRYLYVADGTNHCIWILEREDLKEVGNFGRMGRYPGQFIWLHSIAVDSKGNIYTSEVMSGKRAQKFILQP